MPLTLEDRQEIKDLFFRYAYAIDVGGEEDVLEVFTEDGLLDSPIGSRHAEPVKSFAQGVAARQAVGDTLQRHFLTNFRMDGDGDRASATAYFLQFTTWLVPKPPHPNPTTEFMYAGHYDCLLRRVHGKWLFERRTVHIDAQPEALDPELLKATGR